MPVVLSCQCAHQQRLSDEQMLERLQSRGMLRREKSPDAELLRQLLESVADRLVCEQCGRAGLSVGDDWHDDWRDGVACASCGVTIPAERLEIFPDTTFCPQCQVKAEAGRLVSNDVEYCERCGGILKLRQRGGIGVTGYRMVCDDCGYRS